MRCDAGQTIEVSVALKLGQHHGNTDFGGTGSGGEISQGQCVPGSGAGHGPQNTSCLGAEPGISGGLKSESLQRRAQCLEDGGAGRWAQGGGA
ncbi:hypothetical protein CIK52_15940 [Kocuria rosea]|nr:hypothetical protein [Kocuria sp. CCUG 69068]PAU90412.1 hypothetical protein CK505_11410 [Kocuria sp. WN036]PWF80257.1 hypothetical protein DEJ38_14505 [Kocuria rosea]PWF82580.1 hypothetical protein CIK52_15940 [Kocuria rosea]